MSALAASMLLPKNYKATATLVLNYKGVDPVTGVSMPAQSMLGYMATQIEIIRSKNVARKVVDSLKLAQSDEVKKDFQNSTNGEGEIQDWLAGLLLKKLDVSPSRESSVFEISFTNTNPQFAAAIANAFVTEYQNTSIQLKADPLKNASSYFSNQVKSLRRDLEAAQNRLSKFQQEKGIVSLDNRLDVETTRLNDLSTQLVLVQSQLMDASSRKRQAQGDNPAESPDVIADPLIKNIKASLVQAEARLSEVAQRLDKNHPQYQGAKAEVEKLRAALNDHIRVTANTVGNNAHILQQREVELRSAVVSQKAKVLEFNRLRDELSVLVKDVESAQRAYDIAAQRLSQTTLEGEANQVEAAILNPAIAPVEPSSPRFFLNIALATFLGIILGIGTAILIEACDPRIRSADDLSTLLNAPVLTILATPSQKKRALLN